MPSGIIVVAFVCVCVHAYVDMYNNFENKPLNKIKYTYTWGQFRLSGIVVAFVGGRVHAYVDMYATYWI